VTTSVNGTTGFTFSDGSVLGSQLGIFNRIIDGGFIVNQRTYVSGTSLPSGTYGHDRWKGGASAGTYTFTQGALGVNTTITITAGSIIQVIEGCNLAEGGTYVLSWTGTAQGRLNGGSYGSSGTVTVTGWTAGTNLNVEFNTGSLGNVQLVAGSAVSSYAYRPYGTELALCQRYYQFLAKSSWEPVVAQPSGASTVISCFLKSTMRATPAITLSSITTYTGGTPVVSNSGADAFQISYGAAVGNSQYLTTMSAEL
jgi:hypothetical protein